MQFFFIAYGLACELETRDMISVGLGYLKEERLQRLRREIRDVGAMSKAMIKSLERKPLNPWTLGPSSTTKLEKNHKIELFEGRRTVELF